MPKRRMFWARRYVSETVTGTTNVSFISDLLSEFESAYGADLFGFTVTRIRGNFAFYSQSADTSPGTYTYSSGIRIGTDSQIGDTDAEQAASDPFTDPFADWMWVRNFTAPYPSTTALAAGNPGYVHFDVDIKSQRRLDELGQGLYLYHGRQSASDTAATIQMNADLHILLKRP